jgi:ABC-2 type transport system permease protein
MMRTDLRVVWAELKKSIKIFLMYPVELFGFSIFPILWVIPLVFQGKALTGGNRSPAFAALTGTDHYLGYIMIGAFVSTYVFSSLYGMGGSIREESYYGTLEILLSSPASRLAILLGKGLSDSVISTGMVSIQLILCSFFFHFRMNWALVLPVVLAMGSLVIGLYGLGIGLAGLTLRYKETRGLTQTINQMMFLFTPLRYPVEVSSFARSVSVWIPVTYALIVIRGAGLLGKTTGELAVPLLHLMGIDVVFLGVGLGLFFVLESRTRKAGTLGQY